MAVASNTPSRPADRGIPWLVGRWWFWVLAVSLLFAQPLVRTFLRPAPHAPPIGAALPDFHLVRETGAPFDPTTVSGRTWVVSFVQPGAPDADATLEALFALQKRLRNMGDAVRLVTLPSDDVGTPPSTMAGLAHAHHANARVWLFATGHPMDVARLRAAFGVPAGASGSTSPRLYLVDSRGYQRGSYDRAEIDRLVEDLSVLVNGS